MKTFKRSQIKRSLIALLLLLTLVLTSCGQSSTDQRNDVNETETTVATEVADTTEGVESETADTKLEAEVAPTDGLQEKEVILVAHRDLTPGEKDGYYCSLILEVWEPLVRLGDDGKPEPCLAESWEMSEDGTEWLIHLKEGVKFHDGEPFNADAVVANINRVVDHGPKKSPFYTLDGAKTYPNLTEAVSEDEYTVKLVFSTPSPTAIQRLTNFGSPMVSPACIDENGDFSTFVQGTGPFKIIAHVPDQYTRLEAFTDYYGELAKIKNVKILVMPSPDTRAAALRSGEIVGVLDIGAILASQAHEMSKEDDFVVSSKPSTITHFLQINQARPMLDNPQLIEAISLAIDRNLLVDEFFYGYALASANPLNASEDGYIQDEVIYDPEKAAELAHEVLGDERLSVQLLVPQYGIDRYPYKEQAEYVQACLKEIGIDVEIVILEGSEQMKLRNEGNFDMAFHTQGMPDGNPVTMLNVFMGPDNKGNYHNDQALALLEAASSELDYDKRMDLLKELQELALETRPTLPLYHDHYLIVHHKDLAEYNATSYGVTLSKMYWVNPK